MGQPDPQDWLRAYAKVQKLSDRELLRILEESRRDIQSQISRLISLGGKNPGAVVRLYQLQQIRIAMLREQARIFRLLRDYTKAKTADAAAAAIALGIQSTEDLFRSVGRADLAVQLGRALEVGLASTVDVAVARMTQSRIDLAERIYRTEIWMDGRIETKIASALARGLSAREFATEAVDWFNPNTPGGVRYAAMRLARTEINNAFHAMSVEAADQPWVKGMKWHLSRSHPKPDECDEYARRNPDRLGPGVYKVQNVPRKPHPHCFCFVTPVVEEEDEFLDSLIGGKYDSHIDGILAGGRTLPKAPAKPRNPLEPSEAQKKRIAKENERLKKARDAEAAGRAKEAEALAKAKAAKAKAAAAAKAKPDASLNVTAARRHASLIVERDLSTVSDSARRSVTGALDDAAKVSPSSMRKLERLSCDHDAEWEQHGGPNVGAFYWYSFGSPNHMHFSPRLKTNKQQLSQTFQQTQRSGWQVKAYEDDGIKSITGHEYGHHMDKMATNGTGMWGPKYGRRMSDALGELIGVPGPEVGDLPYHPDHLFGSQVLTWIGLHKKKLEKAISIYGTKSEKEMFAEIWLAYASGNPATSAGLKKIAEIIREAAEENAGK